MPGIPPRPQVGDAGLEMPSLRERGIHLHLDPQAHQVQSLQDRRVLHLQHRDEEDAEAPHLLVLDDLRHRDPENGDERDGPQEAVEHGFIRNSLDLVAEDPPCDDRTETGEAGLRRGGGRELPVSQGEPERPGDELREGQEREGYRGVRGRGREEREREADRFGEHQSQAHKERKFKGTPFVHSRPRLSGVGREDGRMEGILGH